MGVAVGTFQSYPVRLIDSVCLAGMYSLFCRRRPLRADFDLFPIDLYSAASRFFRVARVTSGPMPSPGKSVLPCVPCSPACLGLFFAFTGEFDFTTFFF